MDYLLFVIYLATCAVPAAAGTLFRPGAWYRSLDKPSWTPPDRLFPFIWAVLYVAMAAAAARIAELPGNTLALSLWGLQICINALWSGVFFGLHRLFAGAVIIALLWLAVGATILAFAQLDLIATLLMLPYFAWGSYALALNISVWLRNRRSALAA